MTNRPHTFTVVLEPAEEGGFVVTVPALPELGTQGDTYDEAMANAREANGLVIEDRLTRGEAIPPDIQPQIERITLAAGAIGCPHSKLAEVIRALRKAGFEVMRIKGSHHVLPHRDDARRGTVGRSTRAETSSARCCARSSTMPACRASCRHRPERANFLCRPTRWRNPTTATRSPRYPPSNTGAAPHSRRAA